MAYYGLGFCAGSTGHAQCDNRWTGQGGQQDSREPTAGDIPDLSGLQDPGDKGTIDMQDVCIVRACPLSCQLGLYTEISPRGGRNWGMDKRGGCAGRKLSGIM